MFPQKSILCICFLKVYFALTCHSAVADSNSAVALVGGGNSGSYQDPFAFTNQREQLALRSDGPRLWEVLLVNSTEAVSLIAHMVAFSTRVPVSMANHPPTGGWKLVKHPDSLRASIVQLANKVWDTINLAAVNLDAVQLRMKQVPGNIRMSLRVIRKMRLELIPRLLPVYLEAIELAGARCVELANSTLNAVTETAELIKELQLGVFSTETGRREELRLAKERAEALKELQDKLEEIVEFNKNVYATNENRVNDATKKFYKYLKEIPTGWKKLLQDIVKAGSAALVTYYNPSAGLAYTSSLYMNQNDGKGGGLNNEASLEDTKKKISYTNDDLLIFENVAAYPEAIQQLISLLQSPTALADNINEFQGMKVRLEKMMEYWSDENYKPSKLRKRCEVIVNKIMQICDTVSEAFKKTDCLMNTKAENSENRRERREVDEAEQPDSNDKKEANNPEQQQPCLTDAQKSQFMQEMESAKTAFQQIAAAKTKFQSDMMQSPPKATSDGGSSDAQFKVAQARMHLQNLLQIQQVAQQRVTQSIENLGNLNAKLKSIDLKTVNLKQVIELLQQMAKALTDMIKIWRNLQQFFFKVQMHARNLKDSSKKYAVLGRKHTEIVQDGLADEAYRREMVFQMVVEAQQVNAQSFMVYAMSKTYVDVANNYLLKPLGRVTDMFTVTNVDEVETLRDQISNKTDESKARIQQLILDEERKFNQTAQKQLNYFNNLLDKYGGESTEITAIMDAGNSIANEVGLEADGSEDYELATNWSK